MPTAVVKVEGTVYDRGPWEDRYGHKHKATKVHRDPYKKKVKRSHKTKTKKQNRWYKPKVHTGWKKTMPVKERRRLVLRALGGDLLAAGRGKQALANVTTDSATKREAQKDATYFFEEYRKEKKS